MLSTSTTSLSVTTPPGRMVMASAFFPRSVRTKSSAFISRRCTVLSTLSGRYLFEVSKRGLLSFATSFPLFMTYFTLKSFKLSTATRSASQYGAIPPRNLRPYASAPLSVAMVTTSMGSSPIATSFLQASSRSPCSLRVTECLSSVQSRNLRMLCEFTYLALPRFCVEDPWRI